MRVRLTCAWRSSQVSQEVPLPPQEGQGQVELTWGTPGARVEGVLVRVRNVGRGYARCDLDAVRPGFAIGVVRDTGSWVHTGPITTCGPVKSAVEINTETGRYLLEVLPAAPSSKTPRRRG